MLKSSSAVSTDKVKKFSLIIHFCLLIVVSTVFLPAHAGTHEEKKLMDSLLYLACMKGREVFADIKEYDARLYVRCRMTVNRRNIFMKIVPSMFKFQPGQNSYIAETNNELHYTAPDIYDRKINEITGTFPHLQTQPDIFTDYFYINIFSPTLLQDRLLSPFAIENKSYYRYKLDDYASTGTEFKILIIPKRQNTQLVRGELSLDKHTCTIRQVTIFGQYDLLNFSLTITLGKDGIAQFLPVRYEGELDFKFAGNKLSGNYLADLKYDTIRCGYVKEGKNIRKKLDLTQSYKLSTEHARFLKSPWEFKSYRSIPLTPTDSMTYIKSKEFDDSTRLTTVHPVQKQIIWGKLSDWMLSSHTLNMNSTSTIKISPVINPVLLSYSSTYGYSYRVDFPVRFIFKKGKSLDLFPRIGYNFTNKQFYWEGRGTINYYPQRRGELNFTVGNGERIYNSSVLDKLKNQTNERINFNLLNLEYFNDFRWNFSNRLELSNGLELITGIIYHKRSPFEKSDIGYDFNTPFNSGRIKTVYVSFAPHIRLSFTPRQYYYYSNYYKINTHSYYPTFSIDWERGLKNIMKSSIEYERFEFEINYKLKIKSLRSISARLGYGFFTRQSDIFFVDYTNFTRYSLPYGWEDELGGVFHLLDRRWYNASTSYIRGNIIYESPMLLLTRIPGLPKYIQQERLYLNLLHMNNLQCYVEAGYGLATHLFDTGIFINNINGKFNTFGCKFTFELFRK